MYPCIYACLYFFCDFGEQQKKWTENSLARGWGHLQHNLDAPSGSLTQQILVLVISYQIVISRTKLNIWKDKGKYLLKMAKSD